MNKIQTIPLKIAIIFTIVGISWIIITDNVTVHFFAHDLEGNNQVQHVKGAIFVFICAVLAYFMTRFYMGKCLKKEGDYEMVFKNNPNPMYIYNTKTWQFLDVNYAAIETYGYSKSDFLNMTIDNIRSKTESEKLHQLIKDNQNNFRKSDNWQHLTKNGEILNVEVVSTAITYKKQAARMVTVFKSELSENNVKALSIKNFELSNFRFALEEATILSITDKDGKIEFVNKLFEEKTGFTLPELLGKNYSALNSGLHPDSFFKNIWKTIQEGEIWRGEIKNQNKNGEPLWLNSQILALKSSDGKIEKYISISNDVTQRKIAEEKIAKNTELLKSIAWANSHLIRKPLASILGLVELIKLHNGVVSLEALDYLKRAGTELDNVIKKINEDSSGSY